MRYKIRVTLKDSVISPRRTIDNDDVELDEKLVDSGAWLVSIDWLTLRGVNSNVMIPTQNIAFLEIIPLPGNHK